MNGRDIGWTLLGAAVVPRIFRPAALAQELFSPATHPIFKTSMTATGAEKLRDTLRTLIAMDETRLLTLIPVQTGFISCDCPFGTLTGRVKSVLRKEAGQAVNALEVDGQFPLAVELAGRTVIVHHHGNNSTHGYRVSELRRERGRTLLVLAGEPGFELDANGKSRFLFFPKREIQGPVSYSLSDMALFRA